jgi:hypothetical protein
MSQKSNRRRLVWPTAEIAHIWAHQKAPEGRNPQANFYFNGRVIYSYGSHFPIARLMEHKGKKYVLMTTRRYSSVTAQHLYHVRDAITHMAVFNVDRPLNDRCWPDYQRQAKEAWQDVLACPRAKWNKVETFDGIMDEANDYAKFLGLKSRIKRPENYLEQFNIAEKHEKARNAREIARHIARTEQRRIDDEIAKKKLEEVIPIWRAGKFPTSRLPYHHSMGTMLRLVRRNKFIESSRGVFVPVADAPAIWEKVKQCRHDCAIWLRNGNPEELKIGGYPVDEVHQDGEVRVGCHRLPYPELESIAKQLGYSNEGNLVIVPAESPAANPAQ